MPAERDTGSRARARQRSSASAQRAEALLAEPFADATEATIGVRRAICHALLAIYWELRRIRTPPTVLTPGAHPTDAFDVPYQGEAGRYVGNAAADSEAPYPRLEPWVLDCDVDQLLENQGGKSTALSPRLDLDTVPGRRWPALPQPSARRIDNINDTAWQPAMLHPLHEALLSALVLTTGHGYGDEPEPPTPASQPRYVRRAVEAINADPAHPYTADGLAALVGVKVRTLQQGFRTHLGISPMAYLRSVRLARAHEDLLGDETAGIAEVAYRWGFTHLGRFAAVYAEQYGEAPSRTRDRQSTG
ncbi:MAG TPA: helix-turn-helix domain-containing protein [Catenuloplanes sp.]|jgi:AraC-like DNA-binding protein